MRRFRCRMLVVSIAAPLAAACSTPVFTGFDPPRAPPRSLVRVLVTGGPIASAVWDAGQEDERAIPISVQGPWISIPADAEPGDHPVHLTYFGGETEAIDFVVSNDPAPRLDYPRIDHVMPLDMAFHNGQAVFLLYVQGANLEIGSVVEINGVAVPTLAHKGLPNNLYGINQEVLGYPIHHYVAVLAAPGERAPGEQLSIVVRNPDHVTSPMAVTYTVPNSLTDLDSDGDSLTDDWEEAGHDVDGDGSSDTNVYRRDIFVELDVMDNVRYPPAASTPTQMGTVEAVKAMFTSAPFLNPYGPSGINIAFKLGGTVCLVETVTFDMNQAASTDEPVCGGEAATFSQLKNEYFDQKESGDMYHYVIWARRVGLDDTGMSDMPVEEAFAPGDDVVLGLGGQTTYNSERTRAEMLAHELGHNLGQRHGGSNHEQLFNPNYWSVMSYTWVLRTDISDNERKWAVTCLPLYYAKAHETEPDYQVPMTVGRVFNYSAGMARNVVENDNSLDEATGVCGHEVNWNEDDTPSTGHPVVVTALSMDANDNDVENETIKDFANWPALLFDGPRRNGTVGN
jgi:hypothetical protein